jgi:hypothetical protein
VRVIDDANERLLLADLAQQAENGQADEETVRRPFITGAERGLQRGALTPWKRFRPIQNRHAQLVHGRVGELHLKLGSGGEQRLNSARVAERVLDDRRLADSGLTAQHQRAAAARDASWNSAASASDSRCRPRSGA